jgi:hypothetical protein
MSVAHQVRDGMKCRVNSLFQKHHVSVSLQYRRGGECVRPQDMADPVDRTGAPYALFFVAVLVTGLFAGGGPAICAVLLSMPLGAYTFVVGAGYSIVQASFQSLLFAVDGIVVIYLTFPHEEGDPVTPTRQPAGARV